MVPGFLSLFPLLAFVLAFYCLCIVGGFVSLSACFGGRLGVLFLYGFFIRFVMLGGVAYCGCIVAVRT